MPGNDDNGDTGDSDRKVKDLLDPATRADLERWFSLPSYQQLADHGVRPEPPADDPEVVALLKRRADALAAVEPRLLDELDRRIERAAGMVKPLPPFEIRVDPEITSLDPSLVNRRHTIAEPRDYERPPDLEDELRDCTPQALLRDLHRPDLLFEKVFEIVDPGADQRLDGAAVVAQAMATRWQLQGFAGRAFELGRTALDEARAERRRPWADVKIPPRPVT